LPDTFPPDQRRYYFFPSAGRAGNKKINEFPRQETPVSQAGNARFFRRKFQFPAEGTAVSKARNYEETVID